MFGKVDVPVLASSRNMTITSVPRAAPGQNIFDTGGGERSARELGVPFRAPCRSTPQIGSGDTGRPIVLDDGEHARIIRGIARNMAAQISIRNARQEFHPSVDIQI